MKKIWLCLATAFQAIDGRPITEQMLRSAANNYDFNWRAARVNLNHIRGASGDEPFNSKGDVLEVEVRPYEYTAKDGKKIKTIGLFGLVEFNDDAVALNKKSQNVYSSVELWSGYGGKENEYYLGGVAMTDDPASFGTTRIELSATKIKSAQCYFTKEPADAPLIEIKFDDAEKSNISSIAAEFAAAIAAVFKPNTSEAKADAPAIANATAQSVASAPVVPAELTNTISASIAAFAAEITATQKKIAELKSEIINLKSEIGEIPANYTRRPAATNGAVSEKNRASC